MSFSWLIPLDGVQFNFLLREKNMQRRGYKSTSTLLFKAQIPSQRISATEGTDYL